MAARLGVKHHFAKLNPELVRYARAKYRRREASILDLSVETGVSTSTMDAVLKRRTWKEVED